MKFLFKKIICLILLSVSLAWADQTFDQEILDQVEKAVYRVDIQGKFSGTGFFISEDLFVTASHVVKYATDIHQLSLHPTKGDSFIKIESVEYISLYGDLVILRTQTKAPEFLQKGEVSLNENLTLIGYPQNQFRMWESQGFATSPSVFYRPTYNIQFKNEENLRIQGASGSPLINSKGEYVGIILGEIGDTTTVPYFIPSEFIDKLLNEEAGRKCSDFSCIEEEHQMVREHIERYAYNAEDIPLDGETFFHLSQTSIFEISDRDTVLSYLAKGAVQEKELAKPFVTGLLYLGVTQAIDFYTHLDWLLMVGKQGNVIVMEELFLMYFSINNIREALYWLNTAGDLGDAKSQETLGFFYLDINLSDGKYFDLEKALYWYQQAADQDSDPEIKERAIEAVAFITSRINSQ